MPRQIAVNSGYPDYQYIMRNMPVKIRMAGWEADTHTLQRCGWQVAVEEMRMEQYMRDSLRIALKHPKLKLYCLTNTVDVDLMNRQVRRELMGSEIVLDVEHIACDINVVNIPTDFAHFRPINAEPVVEKIHTMEHRSIESFKIFKPLPEEKEIIVPKESVNELLQKIQSLQEPYQEEMREEKRIAMRKFNREVNEYELSTNIVAQVATLA